VLCQDARRLYAFLGDSDNRLAYKGGYLRGDGHTGGDGEVDAAGGRRRGRIQTLSLPKAFAVLLQRITVETLVQEVCDTPESSR
jgi:hypothetical protein